MKTENKNAQQKKTPLTLSQITEDVCSFYVFLYLFVMAVFFPFFLTWGYRSAGTDKSMLFRFIGLGLLISVLPCALVHWMTKLQKEGFYNWFTGISVSDWLAIGYSVVTVLSYLCSENKQEAFWGAKGWYIGLMTQLFYLASYFFISRFLKGEKVLLVLFGVSTSISFLLGSLNRFSVYPLELEGANPSFIATLGNINWFCGYWSVFFPIAAGLFYGCKKQPVWCRILSGCYLALTTMTGAMQGSDSALLVFGAVILVLFCVSCAETDSRKRFYETMMVIGASCQVLRAVWSVFPERMNYDSDAMNILAGENLTLIMSSVAFLLWLVLAALEKKGISADKIEHVMRWEKVVVLMLCAAVLFGFVFLLVYNTLHPGSIGRLSENKMFTFDAYWGSSRGVTWTAGWRVFCDQPLGRKLIGLGPDSFAYGVYQEGSSAAQMVRDIFGSSRLTNAHNEALTVLVNTGLLGLVTWAGFFLTKAVSFLKNNKKNVLAFACGLAVVGYLSNNLFSFQQVLNGPFVYIALGIGEAVLRKNVDNRWKTGAKLRRN